MKIYTKTGDAGQTGLFGGPRVNKDDVRIEAYGAVDELNAALGWARCQKPPNAMEQLLTQIQNDLFAVGAELATPDPAGHGTDLIAPRHAEFLEQAIDRFEADLPPLTSFILPAGAPIAAALHVARGTCRRAERRVVTLMQRKGEAVSNDLLKYLNRLGDLLFVLARAANQAAGVADAPWRKEPD